MNEGLTIGRVAKDTGVNIQTVRYYERRGLVSPASRKDSGYRIYAPDAVQRICFIKNAQELGFSLKEIAGLLRLRVSHRARCADVKKKAERKLADVKGKIQQLTSLKRTLETLIRNCHAEKTTEGCPILKSLEERNK